MLTGLFPARVVRGGGNDSCFLFGSSVPRGAAGGKKKCIARDGGFSTPPFVCKGGTTGSPRRGDASSMGRLNCSSDPGGIRSCALPSAIARCHTAPIGNLGMRTQATRHIDCTTNLHWVIRSSLFNRYCQDDGAAERWGGIERPHLSHFPSCFLRSSRSPRSPCAGGPSETGRRALPARSPRQARA